MESNGFEILSHSRTHQNISEKVDHLAEDEFKESKRELREMGLNVNNYAYPGGRYQTREHTYAQRHYRSARGSDGYWDGMPFNKSPINTHELKTFWVDTTTPPYSTLIDEKGKAQATTDMLTISKELIDKARDNNQLLIISTHMYNMTAPDEKELFRQVSQYANSNTEVMTLNDALDVMGNVVEVGNYSELGKRIAKGQSHFVVGADGLSSGGATVATRDRFNMNTVHNDFPIGVSYTPISAKGRDSAPEKKTGVLINYRLDDWDYQQNYQEYRIWNSNTTYRRQYVDEDTLTSWKLVSPGFVNADDNAFHVDTPITHFATGITTSIIEVTSPSFPNAPEPKRGTLVTHKVTSTGSYSYNFQEYYMADDITIVYRRRPLSDLIWTAWKRESLVTLPDNNAFNLLTPINDFPIGITYSVINSLNPSFAEAPGGERGTLVTHKTNDGSNASYAYQEYRTVESDLYFQRGAGNDTYWKPWKKFVTE